MSLVYLTQRRCKVVSPSPCPSPPLGGRGEGEGGKPVLFLVGPTGSGKTELSLLLAKRLGAEIVSADSMLVYRGMDIGTAKPTRAERRKIRHHLLDLASPRSNFSVYLHRKRALEAIQEISRREKIPLVVGGSGLYVNAIWKGLSDHPAGNAKLRGRLMEEAKRKGFRFLYEKLRKIDPVRAQGIHPQDKRRIVRALEITAVSGKTPSEWYRKRGSLADLGYSVLVFGVARERQDIYERINQRVERMFRGGLIEEVRRLKSIGFSKIARQALGYREILEYLKCRGGPLCPPSTRTGAHGGAPLQLIQDIQKRTRQFAKRQLTWFRREKEIHWIPWERGESASRVCDKIMKELGNG